MHTDIKPDLWRKKNSFSLAPKNQQIRLKTCVRSYMLFSATVVDSWENSDACIAQKNRLNTFFISTTMLHRWGSMRVFLNLRFSYRERRSRAGLIWVKNENWFSDARFVIMMMSHAANSDMSWWIRHRCRQDDRSTWCGMLRVVFNVSGYAHHSKLRLKCDVSSVFFASPRWSSKASSRRLHWKISAELSNYGKFRWRWVKTEEEEMMEVERNNNKK